MQQIKELSNLKSSICSVRSTVKKLKKFLVVQKKEEKIENGENNQIIQANLQKQNNFFRNEVLIKKSLFKYLF